MTANNFVHRAGRLSSAALMSALLSVLLVAFSDTAARASVAYVEIGSLGEPGVGVGGLSAPTGVAVDQTTGDVYVVDAGQARVDKFNADRSFVLTFGKEVNTNGTDVCRAGEACQVGIKGAEAGQLGFATNLFGGFTSGAAGAAVDPETGDVYVADPVNRRVEKFSPEGIYLATIGGESTPSGEFSERSVESPGVSAIAVDPVEDSGHGGHDLYVTDYGNNVVDMFDSEGAYLDQLDVAEPDAVAFDPGGEPYIVARGEKTIYRFPNSGDSGEPVALEDGLFEAEGIAMGSNGELFIFEHEDNGASAYIVAFSSAGVRLTEFASGRPAPDLVRGGIAVNDVTGAVYFSGGGTESEEEFDRVWSFEKQEETPPLAETRPAREETATSAVLTGILNPQGQASEVWFTYGLTEAYGSETTHTSADSGTNAEEVTAHAEGLQPHATYHYRLFAHSAFGTTEAANPEEFTTLSQRPGISGEAAGSVTQTATTLEAQINPNNETTGWHFEYSTSPSLAGATSLPTPEGNIAAAYGEVPVAQSVSGLEPNTDYYYRADASNPGGGASEGTIDSLLTRPATPVTDESLSITQTQAALTGTLDPGGQDTHYYFQYGTAPCTATSCEEATGEVDAGSSTTTVNATTELSALEPLTIYHYRLVTANAGGQSYGPERELQTLPLAPAVATGIPVSVAAESAIVGGEVVAQGADTDYDVEYGVSQSLSMSTPVSNAGSEATGRYVPVRLEGLEPAITYYYRFTASNAGGEQHGGIASFTTASSGEANPGLLPSGFSLVGPALQSPPPASSVNLTDLAPVPVPKTTGAATKPTKTEDLAKALKKCRRAKIRPAHERASCEKTARSRYGRQRKTHS